MTSSIRAAVVEIGITQGESQLVQLIKVIVQFPFHAGAIWNRAGRRCSARLPCALGLNINATDDNGSLRDRINLVVRTFERGQDQCASFEALGVPIEATLTSTLDPERAKEGSVAVTKTAATFLGLISSP
jgi:hypothetical protein